MIAGDPVEFLLEYGASLANASEFAGMGLCMTFVAMKDKDTSTAQELVRIHTGQLFRRTLTKVSTSGRHAM